MLEVLALDACYLFGRLDKAYAGARVMSGSTTRCASRHCPGSPAELRSAGWALDADVAHAHHWRAGLVPTHLTLASRSCPPTVTTVHNLAFQGLVDPVRLKLLRLPISSFRPAGLAFFGRISFLKARLSRTDRLTTVNLIEASEISPAARRCSGVPWPEGAASRSPPALSAGLATKSQQRAVQVDR